MIYHINLLLDRLSDVLHWRSVGSDTQVELLPIFSTCKLQIIVLPARAIVSDVLHGAG